MMRKFALALSLLWAISAHADITFSWLHGGKDVSNNDLANATTDLAFQVEYSIEGGPLQYVDVAAGKWVNATTRVTERVTVQLLCEQTVVARVKAVYRGKESGWSSQAQKTAITCPTPGTPTDMDMVL